MVDAEAEPVSVAVDWGEIVDVEIDGDGSGLALRREASDEHHRERVLEEKKESRMRKVCFFFFLLSMRGRRI